MHTRLLAAAAVPLLGACATAVPNSSAPSGDTTQASACRNSALAQYAGRPASTEVAAEILRASGATTLQWVAAGTMVTMDHREDRVRIWLDEQNRVLRVSCG